MLPPGRDGIRPLPGTPVTITVDGETIDGLLGQTIAGVILASDRLDWRRTSSGDRPRGVFCGIGVCFDCIAVVNGCRDVRLCQRRARAGDEVTGQHDELPVHDETTASPSAAGTDRA